MSKCFAIVCGSVAIPDHFDNQDAAWAYCYRLQRERIIHNFMIYPFPPSIPDKMKQALRSARIQEICRAMEYLGKTPRVCDVDALSDMSEEQLREVELCYHEQMEALIAQQETPML